MLRFALCHRQSDPDGAYLNASRPYSTLFLTPIYEAAHSSLSSFSHLFAMTTYQTFIARGKPAPVIVHHSVDIAFQQLKELRVLRANLPPSPIYISDGDDSAPAATVKKLPPIVLVASKTTHCEYCKAQLVAPSSFASGNTVI